MRYKMFMGKAFGRIAVTVLLLFGASGAYGGVDTSYVNQLNSKAFRLLSKNDTGAMRLAREALKVSLSGNYKLGCASAYNNYGIFYSNKGLFDSALVFMQKAYEIYSALGDSVLISRNLSNLGSVAFYSGKYASAEEYYKKALHFKPKADSSSYYATIFLNLSMIYNIKGDYADALFYLYDGLRTIGTDTSSVVAARFYSSIGSLYLHIREFDKSSQFFAKALSIFESFGLSSEIAEVSNNLGNLYQEKGLLADAYSYYSAAHDINVRLNNLRGVATCLGNMGQVLRDQKDYLKALGLLNQSLDLRKRLNDQRGMLFTKLAIAEIYYDQSNYPIAIRFAEEALTLALKLDVQREVCATYLLLAKSNRMSGDMVNAYRFMSLYSSAKDTLFSTERTEAMANLSTRYEMDKKEQQLKLQQQEITLLNREQAIKSLTFKMVMLFVLILLLVAMLVVFRLRSKNRVNQAMLVKNRELFESNQELSRAKLEVSAIEREKLRNELNYNKETLKLLAFQIIQKNDFISALQKEVELIEKTLPNRESAKHLKQLHSLIKAQSILDSEKQLFQEDVNKLSREFLDRLTQNYPDLTEDERRLCVYLRLNLSSKEIATLFGISPKSADMKRFRLRKKIGIDSDTSLFDFLQEY